MKTVLYILSFQNLQQIPLTQNTEAIYTKASISSVECDSSLLPILVLSCYLPLFCF